MILPAYS